VLAFMRRGRGRSEGINGEEDFGRDHEGGLIDVSAGIAQAVEDLESAIAYGRKLPGVRPGPSVLLAGQSRSGVSRYALCRPQAQRGDGRSSGHSRRLTAVLSDFRGAANVRYVPTTAFRMLVL
jgi:hypothetical protein